MRKTPVPDRSLNTPCYKHLGGICRGCPEVLHLSPTCLCQVLQFRGGAWMWGHIQLQGAELPQGQGEDGQGKLPFGHGARGELRREEQMELQCSWAVAGKGRALACAHGGSMGQPCTFSTHWVPSLSTEPSWDHAIGFPPSCSMQTPLCIPKTCLGTGFLRGSNLSLPHLCQQLHGMLAGGRVTSATRSWSELSHSRERRQLPAGAKVHEGKA